MLFPPPFSSSRYILVGVFGPESLEEVFDRGGHMTTCKEGTKSEPCSRYVMGVLYVWTSVYRRVFSLRVLQFELLYCIHTYNVIKLLIMYS